jgi:GntR family transcriptional regulator
MPNEQKLTELKTDLKKLIAEAVYLGLTKEDLSDLFKEVHQQIKGDKQS